MPDKVRMGSAENFFSKLKFVSVLKVVFKQSFFTYKNKKRKYQYDNLKKVEENRSENTLINCYCFINKYEYDEAHWYYHYHHLTIRTN